MKETSNQNPQLKTEDLYCIEDILSCGLFKISIQSGEILYANDTFYQLNNCTRENYIDLYQNNLYRQIPSAKVEKLKNSLKASSKTITFYYDILDKENRTICFYLEGKQVIHSDSAKDKVYLCTISDVTNQKLFEEPQFFDRFRSEILTTLYNSKLYWEYNILNNTLYRYGSLEQTYSQEKIIHNYIDTVIQNNYIHKDDEEAFLHFFESLTKGHSFRASVMRFKDNLDRYYWYKLQGSVLLDKNNIPVRIFGTTLEIGKQERLTSSQTELMRKSEFIKSLNEYFKLHRANPLRHSFLLIEIDNYKSLRRTYGKTLLENIIIEAIIELKDTFPNQLLGQITPNMFGVFYEELFEKSDLIMQVKKYQEIVKELYNDPNTFSLTCSVGIMIAHRDSSYNLLYKKAMIALSTAQKKGGGFFDFYGHSKAQQIKPPKVSALENTIKKSSSLTFMQHTLNLLNTDNLEDSLNHYLSHLCQYFQGCHAYIVLKNQVNQSFSCYYHYSTPTCTEDIRMLYQYSFELIGDYETLFEGNHCFVCNDIEEIEQVSPVLADSYRLANVESFAQYGLYENDNWIGYIGIDNCNSQKILTEIKVALFYFVGNFMNHIIKNLQRKLCMALPYKRDKLTGLLTFDEFITQGNRLLEANQDKNYAVISCDINHFGKYNNNFGFTTGNKTLKNYADSLLMSLGENELCTRISDDHFAILLHYKTEDELFSRLVIRSNNSLYNVKQSPDYYRFDVVYGLCKIEEQVSLLDSLNNAVSARKSLKGYTGTRYAIYNEEIQKKEAAAALLNKQIKNGLLTKQFMPYYQPIISFDTNEIIGFEALARWKQSPKKIKNPDFFLSALKEDYSIIELDFQIIQCVCEDIQLAEKRGNKVYPVSINLSITHLMTTNFIERLLSLIRYYAIPFSYFNFEISEKQFIYLKKEVTSIIMELKELGFSITIDDFGSQFSSLNLLCELDIDAIKLSASDLRLDNSANKQTTIFKSLIQLAEELGITVYADKIETEEQGVFFSSLGCNAGQGFYYSKPQPFKNLYIIQHK